MVERAMVVRYFTHGRIDVTAEEDGVEKPSLLQTVQRPQELRDKVKIPQAPPELRKEVSSNHNGIGDNEIHHVEDLTFRVGSNTCVDKLINGQWKRVCD